MPKMKHEPKNKKWRQLYIDILLNGPGKENLGIASELVDGGYTNGVVHKFMDGHFEVHSWEGLTLPGKTLLEDLETQAHRASFTYRAWAAVVGVFLWGGGMLFSAALEFYKCS